MDLKIPPTDRKLKLYEKKCRKMFNSKHENSISKYFLVLRGNNHKIVFVYNDIQYVTGNLLYDTFCTD